MPRLHSWYAKDMGQSTPTRITHSAKAGVREERFPGNTNPKEICIKRLTRHPGRVTVLLHSYSNGKEGTWS